MASIALAGMLVQAPSLRSFDSGSQVCCFCVADRAYVRARKGEEDAPGQFYDVEVWGKAAEHCLDRLHKGSRVAVQGQAIWQEYRNSNGEKRRSLKVTRANLTFLDSKSERQELAATTSAPESNGAAHMWSSSGVGAPF